MEKDLGRFDPKYYYVTDKHDDLTMEKLKE